MDLHCKRLLFVALTTVASLAGCERDPLTEDKAERCEMNFFNRFSADKLGTTAYINPGPVMGTRGPLVKMLDLSAPDSCASEIIVTCRCEYSIAQSTVSQTIGPPSPISNATFAAPIVITTPNPHGLVTGQNVSIVGVRGNLAANGSFTITVTGPTTFSLNGSAGSAAYLGDGTYQSLSAGGTGTGLSQLGAPVVGIMQWGVGGGHAELEFDVPAPRWPLLNSPFGLPDNQPMQNTGNGVSIPITASHVSLYVRHDGYMSPINNPGADYIGNLSPVKVICFAGPGSVNQAQLRRTIFAVGGQMPGPISNLAPAGNVIVNVPPYANKVWIQRYPAATPVRVEFRKNDGSTYYHDVGLAVNSEGPIVIDGMSEGFSVTNVGATNINFLQAVFEVSPL